MPSPTRCALEPCAHANTVADRFACRRGATGHPCTITCCSRRLPAPPYPQAALAEILRYHVVPGTSYKLDQLTDGLWLQTLVEGEKGKLLVQKGPNQQKPTLLTTSGQKVGAVGSSRLHGGGIRSALA